jgi:hypothetical protein
MLDQCKWYNEPVQWNAGLRPGREVVEQVAGFLSSDREVLAGGRDARTIASISRRSAALKGSSRLICNERHPRRFIAKVSSPFRQLVAVCASFTEPDVQLVVTAQAAAASGNKRAPR